MKTAHWFEIGPFRILAKPLPENPGWLTHHVYHKNIFIGKQLSVPSLADCESRLYEHRHPDAQNCSNFERFSEGRPIWNVTTRPAHRRRGRPRKEDAERELAEAMES